jgi:hypothetical protein
MADGVVNKVVSFLTGDASGSEDKMVLKTYIRDITQNRYAKFFRIRSGEFDPSFAAFMYDIYKTLYPIRISLQEAGRMERLKQIAIEAFMDRTIVETMRHISPEAVAEQAKITPPAELVTRLKEDLSRLTGAFDETRKEGVNRCFNQISALHDFAGFDYTGLLKKFDPAMPEGNFLYTPRFQPARTDSLIKDITEFLAVSHYVGQEQEWKTAWEAIKLSNNGTELVPMEEWNRIIADLKDVKGSGIIDYCMRYATKDPGWRWKPRMPGENLVKTWLEAKQKSVQGIIGRITNAQRASQISALVKAIFSVPDIVRLHYYVPRENVNFEQKELDGYIYAEGFNYLAAFLQDVIEKEVRELCDIILIRGQWTNNTASMEMSEAFHQIIEISAEINALDESLSEDSDNGSRLRAAMLRIDRDKTQKRYINSICGGLNDEALEIINRSATHLIIIGRHFKALVDDFNKKPNELLTNWKELAVFSKEPLVQRISASYKSINYFVQLMQLCTQ